MTEHTTIILAYTIFFWLVVPHTFEEIASGVFIVMFTTTLLDVLQGFVHTIGYFRRWRAIRGLGAGSILPSC